ncbi:hypothetical protein ABFS83_14G243200 [Erythranthe nasuta]
MSEVKEPYICWEAIVNGTAGEAELDNILSILDYPIESFEGDEEFVGDWDSTKSEFLGPIPSDVLIGQPVIGHNKTTPIAPVDATPYPNKSIEVKEQSIFQTQSPVSVLESSRSTSSGKSPLIKSRITKRARSKRARKPSGLSPWHLIPTLFASCPDAVKKRGRRKKLPQQAIENSSSLKAIIQFQGCSERPTELQSSATQQRSPTATTKRCTHCQVMKTPQWREGPAGPKTLCNACGVRYRSGRLFPEYRPAASPTFVPTVHSNSHRKVVEMRTKGQNGKIEERSVVVEMRTEGQNGKIEERLVVETRTEGQNGKIEEQSVVETRTDGQNGKTEERLDEVIVPVSSSSCSFDRVC